MPAECEINRCGVLAVGRCLSCNAAFCRTHQGRSDSGWYVDKCGACIVAEHASRNDAIQQKQEADRQALEHALAGVVGHNERLVIRAHWKIHHGGGVTEVDPRLKDDGELARWFASAAIARGARTSQSATRVHSVRGAFGKTRTESRREPAWIVWGLGLFDGGKDLTPNRVAIFADGHTANALQYFRNTPRFSLRGLAQMAEILQLVP